MGKKSKAYEDRITEFYDTMHQRFFSNEFDYPFHIEIQRAFPDVFRKD